MSLLKNMTNLCHKVVNLFNKLIHDITFPAAREIKGVSSAGFNTQVHPAASAAATFLPTIPMGKFH